MSRFPLLLVFAAAVVALAGCQPSKTTTVQRDSWSWSTSGPFPAAQVAARQQSGLLFVGCISARAVVGFWSGTPTENDALKLPELELGYDGAAPVVQSDWTFSLPGAHITADSPHFPEVIRNLKSHAGVEAVIMSGGVEERRREFSLASAGPAIDKALAACP